MVYQKMPVWLDPVFPWWIVFDGQSNLRECPSAGHDPDWMKMCWIYLDIAWYSIVIWTGVSWPQCPSFQWMNSSNHPSHDPIWSRISRRRRVTSFSMRYTSKSPSAWCYLSSGSNNKPKEYPQQPQKKREFHNKWDMCNYGPALLTLEAGRARRNHSANT